MPARERHALRANPEVIGARSCRRRRRQPNNADRVAEPAQLAFQSRQCLARPALQVGILGQSACCAMALRRVDPFPLLRQLSLKLAVAPLTLVGRETTLAPGSLVGLIDEALGILPALTDSADAVIDLFIAVLAFVGPRGRSTCGEVLEEDRSCAVAIPPPPAPRRTGPWVLSYRIPPLTRASAAAFQSRPPRDTIGSSRRAILP
jgi:hypothetical protein